MIMRSISLLSGSFALTSMLAFSPALAECQSWQLLPKFNAIQANGFAVVFEPDDVANGSSQGRASYYSNEGPVEGRAQFTFDGSALTALVQWPSGNDPRGGPLGMYEGGIDGQGSLSGITYQLGGAVRNEVFWRSKQIFQCAAVPEPPKPVRTLGKKKTPPPEDDTGIITQPDLNRVLQ